VNSKNLPVIKVSRVTHCSLLAGCLKLGEGNAVSMSGVWIQLMKI
jgi:hypothetical protein